MCYDEHETPTSCNITVYLSIISGHHIVDGKQDDLSVTPGFYQLMFPTEDSLRYTAFMILSFYYEGFSSSLYSCIVRSVT